MCLVSLQRSVFTHGFVQSVAGDATYLVFDDQRLIEQRRDDVKHVARRNVVEGADTPDIFQRESAGESREAPQHGLLSSRQEVVAPVDCPSKRLMTREGNTVSPGQQGKTVIQATEDLLDRQDPGPHRRQLDRQWQTVEPPAKADDRHPVRVAQREMARAAARSANSMTAAFCCS